jgi:DNA-binding LacI/PurR family transcriptional regulator
MARRTKRPTLADLAAAAGVSRATASNAFNRPEKLSPQLRAKLLALAEELHYAGPDPAAAGLRRGRVGAIGVLTADRLNFAFSDPAALQILDGVAEAVGKADIGLLLLAGQGSGVGPAPARVNGAAVDGFVSYCLGRDDPALDALRRRRLPVVSIDESPGRGFLAVDLDEEGGVTSLVTHLLELGHRRFAIVTLDGGSGMRSGPIGADHIADIRFAVVRRRLDGALVSLADAGIDPADVVIYQPEDNSPAAGELAAAWLVTHTPRPTAIICQSDQLAIGVLSGLGKSDLRVPGDVSVAGFDDIAAATRSVPPLTTVRQPLRERGRKAGELVLTALAGGRPRSVRLPTELVVRGSTGEPMRRRRGR